MKDLIEKILKYIPEYLLTFGRLLVRPKTSLAKTQPDTDEGFRNGLQFLAVSLALVVLALAPLQADGADIWKQLAINSLSELLGVAAMAAVTRLAWYIVGGQASTKSLFTLNTYIASVVVVLGAVTLLMADGTAKVFNPALHAAVRQAQLAHQPLPAQFSKAYLAAAGVIVCGFVVIQVWFIASWGAFRAVNNASRGRSLVAFVLANVLVVPLLFALFAIVMALSP